MSLPVGIIRLYIDSGPVVANGAKVEGTLDRIRSKGESTGKQVGSSSKIMATSLIGLGTAAFSVYLGFDQLGKTRLRAEKASLAVARAQKAVNDLQDAGKTNTKSYFIATEQLRISQEQAAMAADDVNQQIIQLGLSAATTGAEITTAILKLKAYLAIRAAANLATAGHTTANTALTASFRALTVAMLSNPLGIALMAAPTGALVLYSTNVGGIKDKVDGLIGSFGGATTSTQGFHGEIKNGITDIQNYDAALEGVVINSQERIDTLRSQLFGRTLSKDSTIIGDVESYKQLDGVLNNALNDMKTILKFERDAEGVIEKVVDVYSDELEKLGATNQFLERKMRLELQIHAAQERRIKREREESKR